MYRPGFEASPSRIRVKSNIALVTHSEDAMLRGTGAAREEGEAAVVQLSQQTLADPFIPNPDIVLLLVFISTTH